MVIARGEEKQHRKAEHVVADVMSMAVPARLYTYDMRVGRSRTMLAPLKADRL